MIFDMAANFKWKKIYLYYRVSWSFGSKFQFNFSQQGNEKTEHKIKCCKGRMRNKYKRRLALKIVLRIAIIKFIWSTKIGPTRLLFHQIWILRFFFPASSFSIRLSILQRDKSLLFKQLSFNKKYENVSHPSFYVIAWPSITIVVYTRLDDSSYVAGGILLKYWLFTKISDKKWRAHDASFAKFQQI